MAKQRDLVSEWHLAQGKIVRVYVYVPQSGHQICAVKVDFCSITNVEIVAVGTDLADSAVFNQYRHPLNRFRVNTVYERCVSEESAHGGPQNKDLVCDTGVSFGSVGNGGPPGRDQFVQLVVDIDLQHQAVLLR